MICGYGIIAVPTGIVSTELVQQKPRRVTTRACPACGSEGHDADAQHCKYCGRALRGAGGTSVVECDANEWESKY